MDATPSLIDPDAERTERHLAQLRELAGYAMDIARILHAEATQPTSTPPPVRDALPDPSPATQPAPPATPAATRFAVIARCLRHTIALEARLARDAHTHTTTRAAQAATASTQAQAVRAAHLRHLMQPAIEAAGAADPGQLRYDLTRELERPDFREDLLTRPLPELLARLHNTLGLAPPQPAPAPEPAAASRPPVRPTRPWPVTPHPQDPPGRRNIRDPHRQRAGSDLRTGGPPRPT